MKFDHVGVVVRDTDSSIDFYRLAFAAKVTDSHSDSQLKLTFLEVGGQVVELVEHIGQEVPTQSGPVDHIAFQVEDLNEAVATAKAAGATVQVPPRSFGDKQLSFLSGPNGERLELIGPA